MEYLERILDINAALKSAKSLFLLGPRQTGKSTLLGNQLDNIALSYNLLHSEVYLELSRKPQMLREQCLALPPKSIVVIDEIQRLPELLNEVHALIEEKKIQFVLTGSSARKLKKSSVNLLGGRARTRHLHPFVRSELKEKFNLKKALNNGLIPSLYYSNSPNEDLKSYVGDYLTHEISAEGLTRNIPAFSRFLEVAALCNSQILNYTKISNDSQVARSTIQEYFQIIKDTLIGTELEACGTLKKRKALTTSKFYFFDVGVVKCLRGLSLIEEKSSDWGWAFESYIYHELLSYIHYKHAGQGDLKFWKSTGDLEVDFILNDQIAIEVKGTKNVQNSDLKGLRALKEEKKIKEFYLLCHEKKPRIVEGVKIMPYELFLDQLWS